MDTNAGYCVSRMLNHCTKIDMYMGCSSFILDAKSLHNSKIKLLGFSAFHISLVNKCWEPKAGIWYMWR